MKSMRHLQELIRPTLMDIYRITAEEADIYFRALWFVVHRLSTLIVIGDCPHSDREIGQILTGFSSVLASPSRKFPALQQAPWIVKPLFVC